MDLAVVEKQALQLSEGDRALLSEHLRESLDPISPELEKLWIAEIESRMEGYRKGLITTVDGESAIEELRARLKSKRK